MDTQIHDGLAYGAVLTILFYWSIRYVTQEKSWFLRWVSLSFGLYAGVGLYLVLDRLFPMLYVDQTVWQVAHDVGSIAALVAVLALALAALSKFVSQALVRWKGK